MKINIYRYILIVMLFFTNAQAESEGDAGYAGSIHFTDYLKMINQLNKEGLFSEIPYEEMDIHLLLFQPPKFPYILVYKLNSASGPSFTYILFDTTNFKKTDSLTYLMKEYDKNTHQSKPKGFFRGKNGEWLIERYTTKGTPMAECNSCQTYNVETYQLVGNKLVFKSVRPLGLRYN